MLQDNKSLVSEASEFVFDLLKNKLPAHFVYHNMKHTEEVVAAALKIADKLNLNEDDKEIIALATWFHDTGFIEKGDNHEDFSIETARSFLKNKNFSEDKIELVAGCINATRYPQTPTNILEEVTADADLFHLGTKDYASKSELLRMEWEKTRGKQFTEAEWLKINIDFLTSHKYFTRYARKTLEENKTLTLIKLNNKLRKLNDSIKKSELKEEKRQFEKQKLESKIQSIEEKNKQTQSGIETMFRNTLQKHVEFSSTADRKAGIMIFINTLVIVGIVTFLLEKPEAIPQIIIPTLLLLATSLISLEIGRAHV